MNPHQVAAQEHLTHAGTVPLLHQEVAATQALAEAQLSTAYEQHTANLIQYRGITRDHALIHKLNHLINERLGLT